jgi:hypothetical protein
MITQSVYRVGSFRAVWTQYEVALCEPSVRMYHKSRTLHITFPLSDLFVYWS